MIRKNKTSTLQPEGILPYLLTGLYQAKTRWQIKGPQKVELILW